MPKGKIPGDSSIVFLRLKYCFSETEISETQFFKDYKIIGTLTVVSQYILPNIICGYAH